MPLGAIVEILNLAGHGFSLYTKRKEAHRNKIDRMLDEARAASGPEALPLLAAVCQECTRRVEKHPQDAHALHRWGVALWWRAAKASRSEADHIYEQAEQKFAASLAIAPDDAACCSDRVAALVYRAALHSGGKARRLRLQICDLCRKRVGIYWSGPYDARTLRAWGSALWWLAASETGAEAKRLYKEADEKFMRAIALAPGETDAAVDQADVLVRAAALYRGDERREMLQRACRQCEQLAGKGAGGTRMLLIWSCALCWLGTTSQGAEAERFFAEAEKRAARALRIAPETEGALVEKLRALTYRALLQRGETRRNLLTQVCQECARFDKAHPRDADLVLRWGTALAWLASMANRPEADRLFEEAAGKFEAGLSLKPADESLSTSLASALAYPARLDGGETARQAVLRAGELLEAVLRNNPASCEALTRWAGFLSYRARVIPGEETARMAADGVRRFEAAAQDAPAPDAILRGWATALWTLARCVDGQESARLLREAKAKLLESEARVPRSAAYSLACFCAQTGETEECQRWLRVSGEPGRDFSPDLLRAEEDFAPVRECEWFREILAGQAG